MHNLQLFRVLVREETILILNDINVCFILFDTNRFTAKRKSSLCGCPYSGKWIKDDLTVEGK
jgi:hypothetical protein